MTIRTRVQAAIVLMLLTAVTVGGQDAQRRASERLRGLQLESEQLAAQEKTLLVELRQLEITRDIRIEEQRQAEAALQTATRDLAATSAHLESLERAASAQVPALRLRLAELYKLGSGGYVRMLLNVGDMRELGRAYRTVAALAALDRQRVSAHRSTLDSLRRARGELETRREGLARLEVSARVAAASAAGAVAARSKRVAEIDAHRDLNAQLAGELQGAAARLTATVSSLTPGAAATLPFRPFRGALDWPAAGRVTARFGRDASSRFGTAVERNGIEIATAPDTAVAAVHEGRVAYAGPFTGFGNLVIVDHGDKAFTLYGYLAGVDVTKGAHVEKGTRLGRSGTAPAAGPPALYFEVRIDGRPADPLQWLKPRF